MKALVLEKPGDLTIEERDTPSPGAGDVLVRIANGGICGSDLHYFLHGGFGTVRMKAPMVLGHELAGVVEAVGGGVKSVSVGDQVAVNPSLPCGACSYCESGKPRLCSDMRFMGSAMRTPHVDGGFRQYLTCTEAQAVPVGEDTDLGEASVSEPLAVCLHAVAQGPDLARKKVLVSGFGPIGALTLLAARHAGATDISAADIAPAPLALAKTLDASTVYDASDPDALAAEKRDRGKFDVVFECSGHPASIQQAIDVTRAGGTIIQVGMTPDTVTLAINPLITKELTFRGTFRFDSEFNEAARLIASRTIDVRPVISSRYHFSEAREAFECAMDRKRAIKVVLDFSDSA